MSQPSPEPTVSAPRNGASPESDRWFKDEIQPHESALKAWLRCRFPRLVDVDDIVQVALFRLWKRQRKPDATPLKSPKAALFATARNAVIDLNRRAAVAKTDAVAEIDQLPVLDEGADVIQSVAARQELEFFAEALSELPDRSRQVITLTKVYGLTEREVAERLGIADSTVHTHLMRGMEKLHEYFRVRGITRGEQ